jgi:VWFA-related protein
MLILIVGLSDAQDVQMVPDQQDRDSAEKAQTPKKEEDQEPVATFKARSDLVQQFFNVKGKNGGLIGGLTKDDFDLFENGKPQTIKFFTANTDLPLTLGILIDTSLSQQNVLGMEQLAGGAFLSQVLKEKDQAFVMDFNVSVSLVQDFTSSARRLKDALNSVKINTAGQGAVSSIPGMGGGPVPTMNREKGTLLYDAVVLASHDQMGQQVDRKAMILLTDGQDEGSELKIKDAIEAAQKADTIVYVLLCADRQAYFSHGMIYSGSSEMRKLTAETGGRAIDVGDKPEKLKAAFQQISDELRSQYSIGYVPTNTKRDGTFRKIEIKPKQDYKIQTRSGYFAIAE